MWGPPPADGGVEPPASRSLLRVGRALLGERHGGALRAGRRGPGRPAGDRMAVRATPGAKKPDGRSPGVGRRAGLNRTNRRGGELSPAPPCVACARQVTSAVALTASRSP